MRPQSHRASLRLPIVVGVEARSIGQGEKGTCSRGVLIPSAQRVARRRALERVWIVVGFGWAIARVIFAKATVEKYGVNITMFALIELMVAWPHSLSAARLVTKLIDRDPAAALPWGVILAGTHIAPELYVALAGSNMSTGVYVSLVVIVVGLGALAIVGIVQKVAAGGARPAAVGQDVDLSLNDSQRRGSEIDVALAALVEEESLRSKRVGTVRTRTRSHAVPVLDDSVHESGVPCSPALESARSHPGLEKL